MTEPEPAPGAEGPAAAAPGGPPGGSSARRRRALAALLAWLVPGAGHLLLGQWWRGTAFLVLVLGCAAVGVGLEGRLYWFGEGLAPAPADELGGAVESRWLVTAGSLVSVGLGVAAAALRWGAGYQGVLTAPGYEYGSAFLLTAGLMNLLLVLDAWDGAGAAPEAGP